MAGFNDTKITRRLVLKRVDANTSYPIPAGAAVRRVQILNRTANAVTGGINVGTTSGGTQIVSAAAVAASALVEATVASTGLSTSAQTLYIQAGTAWNNAEVDVAIEYDELLDSKGKQPSQTSPSGSGLGFIAHDPV